MCLAVEDVIEDVDGGAWLEGNASSEALVVDVLDEFLRAGLLVGGSGGFVGGGGVDSGFVMEAVEIASGLLELLDPFLGLVAMVNKLFLGVFEGDLRLDGPRRSSCGSRRYPCQRTRRACRHEDESL